MANIRKIKSVKEMEARIASYFELCEGEVLRDDEGCVMCDANGRAVIEGAHPPTVTGLALHLGLKSRQALLNYQGRPEFRDCVERAKMRIEAYAEARLYDRDGVQGAKFTLTNNFRGWAEHPISESDEQLKRLDALIEGLSDAAKR